MRGGVCAQPPEWRAMAPPTIQANARRRQPSGIGRVCRSAATLSRRPAVRARGAGSLRAAAALLGSWRFPGPPAAVIPPPSPSWTASDGPRPLMVDTHADTTQRIVYQGASFQDGIPGAHLDLEKMRAGGLDAEFFSIFVLPARTPPATYFGEALMQIHAFQALAAGSGGRLALAR